MITLTTDFGTADPYVAEMKGVILQLNPQAAVMDISHHISPQDIVQGAFVLGSAYRFFPNDTIHVAVVDPGVGTSRRAILLTTGEGLFLAPDNGLLTYVLRDTPEYRVITRNSPFLETIELPLPSSCTAYNLSNRDLWWEPVSSTFHGRDIFAPVAAHLSLGLLPEDVGDPVSSLTCLCVPHPRLEGDTLVGHVIHVDGFGNLVTTIDGKVLAQHRRVEMTLKGKRIHGVSSSYAEHNGLLAIIGSHGNLEIALKNGNASQELNASVGDEVAVELVV